MLPRKLQIIKMNETHIFYILDTRPNKYAEWNFFKWPIASSFVVKPSFSGSKLFQKTRCNVHSVTLASPFCYTAWKPPYMSMDLLTPRKRRSAPLTFFPLNPLSVDDRHFKLPVFDSSELMLDGNVGLLRSLTKPSTASKVWSLR